MQWHIYAMLCSIKYNCCITGGTLFIQSCQNLQLTLTRIRAAGTLFTVNHCNPYTCKIVSSLRL